MSNNLTPEEVEKIWTEAKRFAVEGLQIIGFHRQVTRLCVEYVEERLHWLTYSENAVKEIPVWQALFTKIKESNHAQRTKRSKKPIA